MNRAQRRAHARLWPVLALLLAAAFAGSLLVKAGVDRAASEAPASPIGGG
jgi:hypothetical protein